MGGVAAAPVAAAGGVSTLTGQLPDGATYLIQVPSPWNGTLVLYSHGYVVPGYPNPAQDVGDPVTGSWLLGHGYALAGSSYAITGWALQFAVPDQIATLNVFDARVGTPSRTIAWGHSLGGMITAALLQEDPDRFTAALPMCGVLGGGVGTWNQALDSAVAIQRLLAPAGSGLQVVDITDPTANLTLSEQILAAAQQTPQGRARIALAAALGDVPGWFTPLSPEPAPTDYAAQELNQFLWETQVDGPFAFAFRAQLEALAGGNPSWTTGVNFASQLEDSVDYAEVRGLYEAAGLDLDADLHALNASPRIVANRAAVRYLAANVDFNGELHGRPVLTIHTIGDGLVVNEAEQAYLADALARGDSQLLRQVFVDRAGHCAFTPAETIAAFQALVHRVDTGTWVVGPTDLDKAAAALGPSLNIFVTGGAVRAVAPAYVPYEPAPFLRPYPVRPHR
jgi:pimeloyl-ACP methyl ester carboxylesterase